MELDNRQNIATAPPSLQMASATEDRVSKEVLSVKENLVSFKNQ